MNRLRGSLFLFCIVILLLTKPGEADEIAPPPDALKFFQKSSSAAVLFSQMIEHPGNETIRIKLAQIYVKDSGSPMKIIIQGTIDYVQFKQVTFSKPAKVGKGTMSCPGSLEELAQVRSETKDIGRKLEERRDEEVVEYLRKLVKSKGDSCQLASEWAYAVVHSGINYPKNTWTTSTERELAVRWLVLIAEELKEFPQYRIGEAPIYETLTSYFSMNGDYVTAYVCASRAIEWASAGSIGLTDKKDFCDHMQKRLDKLDDLAQNENLK